MRHTAQPRGLSARIANIVMMNTATVGHEINISEKTNLWKN
jgi:hypothetical protein